MNATFAEVPSQQLARLIHADGPAILDATDRCMGWLLYQCPDHRREVNILVAALREGVPQELLGGSSKEDQTRQLMESLAMTEDAAAWAVRSWATALEVRAPMGIPEMSLPIAPSDSDPGRRRAVPFSPKRNVTEQVTLPPHESQPAADTPSGNLEDRRAVIHALECIVAIHEAVKTAGKADIITSVVCCSVVYSSVLGGIGYGIMGSLSSQGHSESVGAFGSVLGIIAGFLLANWHCSKDREKVTSAAGDDLTTAIKLTADKFPKSVCAFGGPALLRDIEALRHIICSLKAEAEFVVPPRIVSQPPAPQRHIPLPSLGTTLGVQPHRGAVVLTLGVLGFFLPLLAVLAWVMGHSDLRAMEARKMDTTGEGQTRAGRILGMIVCIFWGTLIVAKLVSSK